MAFRLHKRRAVNETAIIFDIGSASIGAALVHLEEGSKPEILYTTRKEMQFTKDITSQRLLSNMRIGMTAAGEDIQKNGIGKGLGNKRVKNIYCIFSAPWYVSQTKTIKSSFNKEKTITDSFLYRQIEKEEREFVHTEANAYAHSKEEELHILEHSLIQMKLNGYNVEDIHGKKARDMEMSIFMSMIPDVAARAVIDVISNVFHTENLHMHSFGLASYSVLRNIYEDVDNFILLDISGEVTDVILVNDDILVESATFPFGKHKLARELSKSLGTTAQEAISRIVLHGSGDSEGVMVLGKTQELVDRLRQNWNAELKLILKDYAKDYPIPQKMFFLSDENVVPVFKHFLETEAVASFISPDGTFTATPVKSSVFDEYVSYKEGVKKDPFLAIEAIFFNSAHKPHD